MNDTYNHLGTYNLMFHADAFIIVALFPLGGSRIRDRQCVSSSVHLVMDSPPLQLR